MALTWTLGLFYFVKEQPNNQDKNYRVWTMCVLLAIYVSCWVVSIGCFFPLRSVEQAMFAEEAMFAEGLV